MPDSSAVERANRGLRALAESHQPVLGESRVALEAHGIRVEVRGAMARLLVYLATDPEIVEAVGRPRPGQLNVTWGQDGGWKASTKQFPPGRKSSTLMDDGLSS